MLACLLGRWERRGEKDLVLVYWVWISSEEEEEEEEEGEQCSHLAVVLELQSAIASK